MPLRPARGDVTASAALVLLWGAAFLVLIAPALANGFPLVFDDTNVYVSPLRRQAVTTPPFYSVFVFLVGALLGLTLLPAAQAACVLATIELSLRSLAPGASAMARAAVALSTALLTQLPWLASWIMPDFLFGLGVLTVAALTLAPAELPGWQRVLLAMMALFSALAATANVLVLAPLAVLCLLLRRFLFRQRTPRPLILGTVLIVGTALALPIAWNALAFGTPSLNPARGALLVSKFLDAGLAQPYLEETCPRTPHPICPHLGELPPDDSYSQNFLWGTGGPPLAQELNAWRDPDGSFAELATGVALAYPREVLGLALADAWTLVWFPTLRFGVDEGGELRPFGPERAPRRSLLSYHPDAVGAYDEARQQTGRLQTLFPVGLYRATTLLSYAGLLLMALATARGNRRACALTLVVGAAILGGLAVHGGLVGPFPRYHVKLSWLATFALLAWTFALPGATKPAGGR